MRARTVVILVAAAVACGRMDTISPEGDTTSQLVAQGLRFSASVSKETFSVGDSATFRLELLNAGKSTVKLTFSSGCQILPYITNANVDIVYPSGGAWACTAAITSLTIAPGEKVTRDLTLRGASPQADIRGAVALGPGTYNAHGELGDEKGKSNVAMFTITH